MKIIIFALGTRGDVQPPCVLGRELKNRGHLVTVATEQRLKYIVDQYELEFYEIKGDGAGILLQDDVIDALNKNDFNYVFSKRKELDINLPERLEGLYHSSKDMDLIISCPLTITEANCLSQKFKIPNILLILQPNLPTGDFPNMMMFHKNFYFRCLNQFTYTLFNWFYEYYDNTRLSNWFKFIGISEGKLPSGYLNFIHNDNQVVISAIDKIMIPSKEIPKDYKKDWYLTGFLFPKEENFLAIPEKLIEFIKDEKDKPIVFSLGSMKLPNENILDMVIKVCTQRLNSKLILICNWSKFSNVKESNRVLIIDQIDHGYLYPKCKAIIHHGGVGSTGAVLRSGTPSIVTHMYADQPYFGSRIQDLGVGKSFKLQTLNEKELFDGLLEITTNSLYKQKALEISDILKSTDSSKLSADIIENSFNNFKVMSSLVR